MNWAEFTKVLPVNASINDAGHLAMGGRDAVELAEEFGTPMFVCDLDDLRMRIGRYRDAFGADNVYYASKAFLTRSFALIIEREGISMDCVAGGELYVALAGGFPAARIGVHGNNKSRTELAEALEAGTGRIFVDSLQEIELLDSVAGEAGVRPQILLRITPGVEVHTHSYLATGVEDSKFGFTIGDVALKGLRAADGATNLDVVGLHCHIGSQALDLQPFAEAARTMTSFLAECRATTGLELPELNIGGGLGIAYTPNDEPPSVEELGRVVRDAVETEAARAGTPVPTIKVEPGRSIVGPSMVSLYTVGVVKDVPDVRRYVAVDGGMSDNIRVPLYQATYTYLSATRPRVHHDSKVTVAGKLCETGDLIGHDVVLPDVDPGEILACAATGAYGYAMASHYNKQPRPPVVGVSKGEVTVLARRETYADLIRLE